LEETVLTLFKVHWQRPRRSVWRADYPDYMRIGYIPNVTAVLNCLVKYLVETLKRKLY